MRHLNRIKDTYKMNILNPNRFNLETQDDSFRIKMLVSDLETITLPASGSNNFSVSWGDGSLDEQITTPSPTHTYTSAGEYEIVISGIMTSFSFNNGGNAANVTEISVGNTGIVGENAEGLAYGCVNMTLFDTYSWDSSSITSLANLIRDCISLITANVESLNVSNVTDFSGFARDCESLLILDCGLWDTSKAITFSNFASSCFNLNTLSVSGWDTSNVISFASFAYKGSSLTYLDVSGWNTANVQYFNSFMYLCSNVDSLDVSSWNTASVITFDSFIRNAESLSLLDMSNWDTSSVATFRSFARKCYSLIDIYGIESINLSSCSLFIDMFANTSLPESRYNSILNINSGWPSQVLLDGGGLEMDFGASVYSLADTDAVAGRADLISVHNYNVVDGGGV